MAGWSNKSLPCGGTVLFRGTLPPRLENFSQLTAAGITLQPLPAAKEAHWAARIQHPQWGVAEAMCLRSYQAVPRILVDHDPRLTPEDRADIHAAGSWVNLKMEGSHKNILRDRKTFLRFLNLFMADDGIIAIDHLAQRFWTRQALADELVHDADVDIEALFISHAVSDEDSVGDKGERRCGWLHTHGLAELGALDFDILRPAPLLLGNGYDTIRALAYILLEKGPAFAGQTFSLFSPGGEVNLTPVEEFNKNAPTDERAIRGDPRDPAHNRQRVIVCEPGQRRFMGLMGPSVRASRACSTVDSDHLMARFPGSATRLMERRAQQTYAVFAALAQEFADFQVKPIAKIGYPVDGSNPAGDQREHMWFEVHAFHDDAIDATLHSQPYHIAGMHAGDRGMHPIQQLTDWILMTPAGSITPRSMFAARMLRTHGPEIRQAMAKGQPQA